LPEAPIFYWKNMRHKIALFVYQPYCSIECGNAMMVALSPQYDFKMFSRQKVRKDFFDDVDIVCFPGGDGTSDSFDWLLKYNREPVTKFMQNGGRYLGVCMGAYWTDQYYFDFLKDTRAVQYITQPNTDTRRPHAKATEVVWRGQKENMYFYDGCAFTGNNFETIATYANGDAMAIMQDRLGLIGCHPESEQYWYNDYKYLNKHWHEKKHHELLLNFTNELMQR